MVKLLKNFNITRLPIEKKIQKFFGKLDEKIKLPTDIPSIQGFNVSEPVASLDNIYNFLLFLKIETITNIFLFQLLVFSKKTLFLLNFLPLEKTVIRPLLFLPAEFLTKNLKIFFIDLNFNKNRFFLNLSVLVTGLYDFKKI